MKHLSLKLLIACILLPPMVYVFSINALQAHLHERIKVSVENTYLGDVEALFQGNRRLAEAVSENIQRCLKRNNLKFWGLKVNVTVIGKGGTIIYPRMPEAWEHDLTPSAGPMEIAAENYHLMGEGLIVQVDTEMGHNTLLANLLLTLIILVAMIVLYAHYRSASRRSLREDRERGLEIQKLQDLEKANLDRLKRLEQERAALVEQYSGATKELETEKAKFSSNEEAMIQEIVDLEAEIEKTLRLQEEKETEIETLKEQIKRFESKHGKQKTKSAVLARRRFNAIYKNLAFNDRAIDGFDELEEDLKIKCEEIIHRLNEDARLVTIKRKVFGRKNRKAVLEVVFGYKGRLYCLNTPEGRIEILAVGTKNTQDRALEFLDGLA